LESAFATVLRENQNLARCSVREWNCDELPGDVDLHIRCETAGPNESIDPHSGALWLGDVHVNVSTPTGADKDGQTAQDTLAVVRDAVYAASFLAAINAQLTGIQVDALSARPDASDEAEDSLNSYALLCACKLQTTA